MWDEPILNPMSCRMLLKSSVGEACSRSQSLSINHSFYRRKCIKTALSRSLSAPYSALRRSTTARGVPSLWAPSCLRSLHNAPFLRGRYITSEITEAYTSAQHEAPSSLAFDGPDEANSLSADRDAELDKEDSKEEEKSLNFFVVNFYVLVHIDDPQLEVARHTAFVENKDIRGRILISSQGINAQYSGPREVVIAYASWVQEDPRFSSLYVQISPSVNGHAFPRLKLRYKPSLVQLEGGTASLPIIDPSSRAIPLSSREWREKLASSQSSSNTDASSDNGKEDANKLMQRPVLLLDVRNGYEWDIGHFEGAQRPPVDCFKSTEFGLQYNEDKDSDPLANVDKENTDILMYCTGGIRCDVYSAVLRQKGYKNLYSLKGGVARYLSEEDGEKWLGSLFVFDSRLSVAPASYKQSSNYPKDMEDTRSVQGESPTEDARPDFCKCSICGGRLSHFRHRNCANIDCNRLFLCCEQCACELVGCCSPQCTSAPRQRPYFSTPQQYQRWHNYREGGALPSHPAGYVGKRAKRRLRDLEQEQLQNASISIGKSFKSSLEEDCEGEQLHVCADS